MHFDYAWIVHMRGNQLVPQLLLKQSDALLTQYRHIEHLCEEDDKILIFDKMIALCLCLDSAYIRKSACTRPFTETS